MCQQQRYTHSTQTQWVVYACHEVCDIIQPLVSLMLFSQIYIF